ncbi:MAG TPA: hypothetical protein VNE71_03955 [Myxococcota bacterium]|jgi:hypothetical protein|nr:hypothetical protein [Myxococcota bacterium]
MRLALIALATLLTTGAASAQTVKAGAISGTIVSAAGTAPSGGTDAALLTTPATGAFILTQVCTMATGGANNQDNIHVVGSTLGRLALETKDDFNLGSCTTFQPGFALPPGEELRCVQVGASGSAGSCTVIGVVSKK